MIAPTEADVLRYAGALGHAYVVVVDRGDGTRGTHLHTNNRQDAIRTSWELERLDAHVYQQIARGKWRKVR